MLRESIGESLKKSMLSKDNDKVATLRLILAALKDRDIAARSKGVTDGIGDDEVLSMLQGMIKQRRDSIELYEKGNRLDLANKERREIEVIENFLPKQMDESEMETAIDAAVKELDCSGMKDMGRCMAALKERHAGAMDFSKASGLLKARLSR